MVFAIMAAWTLLALLFASQGYLASAYRGRPQGWWETLGYSLAFYAIWALLTPAILWLVARVPFEPRRVVPFLAVHVPASILTSLGQALLFALIFWPLYSDGGRIATRLDLWQSMLVASFHSNLLIYWVVTGLMVAIDYYGKFRDRELRGSRLEARLAQAEIAALRAQLQPHFLFNTLHAISALVRDEPRAAERMIARLGDLLRMTLDKREVQETALRHELAFLDAYLEIEQARLGDRLRVERAIDPTTLDVIVPDLLLQPLVENAIRHGIAPRAAIGTIFVAARRDAERLQIEVRDNGKGAAVDALRDGVGLANTRSRLEQLYGDMHRFDIVTSPGTGFAVRIDLPWRSGATEEVA